MPLQMRVSEPPIRQQEAPWTSPCPSPIRSGQASPHSSNNPTPPSAPNSPTDGSLLLPIIKLYQDPTTSAGKRLPPSPAAPSLGLTPYLFETFPTGMPLHSSEPAKPSRPKSRPSYQGPKPPPPTFQRGLHSQTQPSPSETGPHTHPISRRPLIRP